MAYVIQENTGENIFRILPETPYPTDHSNLVDLAQDEQRNNARPKIKDEIENFSDYETVWRDFFAFDEDYRAIQTDIYQHFLKFWLCIHHAFSP